MKYLIITAAGCSQRFNRGEPEERLKCIYYEKEKWHTLLYRTLKLSQGIDRVVITGGFRFGELASYAKQSAQKLALEIQLTENHHYREYGSGYSLKLGLEKCLADEECREVVFAEGDLFFDEYGYRELLLSEKSCLSFHGGPILAEDSVAVYFNRKGTAKYIYDTEHHLLRIGEPFTAILNSAQIWKFQDRRLLDETFHEMREDEWKGTNLLFIEKYFGKLRRNYAAIGFNTWINCNTRDDYRHCCWGKGI